MREAILIPHRTLVRAAAIGIFVLFCFFLFLFCGDACAHGITEGLELTGAALLPSLFPMACAAKMLSSAGLGARIGAMIPRGVRTFFGISESGAGVLLCSLFSGFPTGAMLLSDGVGSGAIEKREAAYLLPVVNAASPGFLIGYVGRGLMKSTKAGVILFAAQTVTVLLCCRLFRKDFHNGCVRPDLPVSLSSVPGAIAESAGAMLGAVGTVLFFSALRSGIDALFPPGADPYLSFILPLFEIAGGMHLAVGPSTPLWLAAIYPACCGLAVHGQILIFSKGVPKDRYLAGKLLFLLCNILSVLFFSGPFILKIISGAVLLLLLFLPPRHKKRSDTAGI